MYSSIGGIREGLELNLLALEVLRFQGGYSCPTKKRGAGLEKVIAV